MAQSLSHRYLYGKLGNQISICFKRVFYGRNVQNKSTASFLCNKKWQVTARQAKRGYTRQDSGDANDASDADQNPGIQPTRRPSPRLSHALPDGYNEIDFRTNLFVAHMI